MTTQPRRSVTWAVLTGLAVLGLVLAIGIRSCGSRETRLVYDSTPAHEAELKNIVDGAVTFTLLHEAGHMMISELNLPVLGHEEDAADSFAVFVLTLDNPDVPEGSRGHTAQEGALLDAAVFFDGLYWDGRLHKVQPDWSDEHGQPEQRSNAISCLTIGIDPKRFSEFALQTNIPKHRLDGCPAEAARNKADWAKTLFPAIEQSRTALDQPITLAQIVSPESSPNPNDPWATDPCRHARAAAKPADPRPRTPDRKPGPDKCQIGDAGRPGPKAVPGSVSTATRRIFAIRAMPIRRVRQ
jgi:hypothetical protein